MYYFIYTRESQHDGVELVDRSFRTLKELLQWTIDNGVPLKYYKTRIIGPKGVLESNLSIIEQLVSEEEKNNEVINKKS